MSTIYLNIGSNLGERHALIEQAVALIIEAYPEAALRRSDFIESEPWGYDSPHPYLNLGLALDFDECPEPLSVLDAMQHIERSLCRAPHRNADGTYHDREVDIDIIAIDDLHIRSPRLTLPHPRATKRDFVTIPLRQLGYPYDLR